MKINHTKNILDAFSGLAVFNAWAQVLSPILTVVATTLAIIWTGIRIAQWAKGKQHGVSEE